MNHLILYMILYNKNMQLAHLQTTELYTGMITHHHKTVRKDDDLCWKCKNEQDYFIYLECEP